MNNKFNRLYINALYVIIGLMMTVNTISFFSGAYIALLPLALQSTIVFALIKHKSWTSKIVSLWATLLILGGALSLFAAIMGNRYSVSSTLLHLFCIIAGLFFAYFANSVFSSHIKYLTHHSSGTPNGAP